MLQWLKFLRETALLHRAAFWEWPFASEQIPVVQWRDWWWSSYGCVLRHVCASVVEQLTGEAAQPLHPLWFPGEHFCKPAGLLLKCFLDVYIAIPRTATVCISVGDVCIWQAVKYYNVVLALLHLHVMRGAVSQGRMCSGGEELREHVRGVRACKSRMRQKDLVRQWVCGR